MSIAMSRRADSLPIFFAAACLSACGTGSGETGSTTGVTLGNTSVSSSGDGDGDTTGETTDGTKLDMADATDMAAGTTDEMPECGQSVRAVIRDFQESHPDFQDFSGDVATPGLVA